MSRLYFSVAFFPELGALEHNNAIYTFTFSFVALALKCSLEQRVVFIFVVYY